MTNTLVQTTEHVIDTSSSPAPDAGVSEASEAPSQEYADNGEVKGAPDPVHLVDLDRVEEKLQQHKLRMLAETEDPTDYMNERNDQEAWKRGDPGYNDPRRQQERLARNERLLEQYRQEAAAALEHEPTEIEARIERERLEAKSEVRVEQWERENPGYIAFVKETIATHGGFTEEVAVAIHRSPLGPAIVERICLQPDFIAVVNNAAPPELEKFVAYMEGVLDRGHQVTAAPRAPAPELPKPKLVSSAPKPVTTVGGQSHSPSKSLEEMSYDEYAKTRRAQMMKARSR